MGTCLYSKREKGIYIIEKYFIIIHSISKDNIINLCTVEYGGKLRFNTISL